MRSGQSATAAEGCTSNLARAVHAARDSIGYRGHAHGGREEQRTHRDAGSRSVLDEVARDWRPPRVVEGAPSSSMATGGAARGKGQADLAKWRPATRNDPRGLSWRAERYSSAMGAPAVRRALKSWCVLHLPGSTSTPARSRTYRRR